MSQLNIKVTESRQVAGKAKVQFSCTLDIKDTIVSGIKEVFEIEMLQSGSVSEDITMCTIKFKMQDAEKLTRLKQGMFTAVLTANSHLN